MPPAQRISIVIDTQGNPSGIDVVTSRLHVSEHAASELFATLKAGAAIDIGGRLVEGIARIPEALQESIRRGVEFNATLQTSQLGIAAVLKQFDSTGKFKTFDDAMAASAGAIELLKQKAKESPATFQSLVQTYQALAGPLTAANIPLEKQVDLITNMSQALSGLGIPSQQLLQETRALVTGNINADAAAAKILGITAADISGAKAKGQLYEFLSGKISAFAEAGKRGSETYTTALSNLDDAIDDVLAKVSKPIFEALTKGTLDLSHALDAPQIVESLRDIGEQIAALVKDGYELTEWAVRNSDVLVVLAKVSAGVGAGFAAIKLANLLLDIGRTTVAWIASRGALDAETAALGRNTAAQLANGAARKLVASVPVTAATYGRSAASLAAEEARAAEIARRARLANQGRWAGSILTGLPPAAAAGEGAAGAAASGGAVASVAAVVVPLAVAAVAALFIRSQISGAAAANASRIDETSARYAGQTMGNLKAMSAMATFEDKLAVSTRIRTQMEQVEKDRYDAIAAGDEKRVQMASQQLVFLEKQESQLDAVFDRVHQVAGEEAYRLRIAKEMADFIKYSDTIRAARVKDLPAARSDYKDAVTASMSSDIERLSRLRDQRADLPSWTTLYAVRDQIDKMPLGAPRDSAEDSLLRNTIAVLNAEKQIDDLEKSISAHIADQVKKLADQAQARQDYILDYQLLQAQADGNDALVKSLEHQKALREEIRSIMEKTGASEEEATRAAGRTLALKDRIAARDKAGAAPSVSAGSPPRVAPAGDRIGITGPIGTRTPISSFDYRRNGEIGGFGTVVPRIAKPAAPVAGAGASDLGGLAAAVKAAQDAFNQDDTMANKKKLVDELNKLVATLKASSSQDSAVLRALTTAVSNLQQQVAGLRSR